MGPVHEAGLHGVLRNLATLRKLDLNFEGKELVIAMAWQCMQTQRISGVAGEARHQDGT